MARLEIRLLGTFKVSLGGEAITTFESNKVRALLAYLTAEAPRPQLRQRLAGLLWPDWPQKSAMSNLRYALADLRKNLHDREAQPPFLLISREIIGLNPESDVWVDVEKISAISFQLSAISSQLPAVSIQLPPELRSGAIENLKSAIAHYRGEFLEGFSLDDSPDFEEWILAKREYFKRRALKALHSLAEEARQRGASEEALAYARRQLELEPWHEEAHRQVMHLLAMSGQRSAALAQYETCRRLLKDGLGVEPSEETTRLYEQIRGGMVAAPPGLPDFLQTGKVKETETPSFVARQTELSRLGEALERALAGKGQAVFITGSPGRGKTSLAQEFIRLAINAHPDLAAAYGNCQAYFGKGEPYLPFREVLEMLTGGVEERWAAGNITREHASRLWRLIPRSVQAIVEDGPALVETFLPATSLLKRVSQAVEAVPAWLSRLQEIIRFHQQSPSGTHARQDDLFSYYIGVLRSISRQSPLLLFLDDLQWADPGSLSLLFTLGRQIGGNRILIVGTYRPEGIRAETDGGRHPLAAILSEFQLLYGDLVIDLDEVEDRLFIDALIDQEPNRLGLSFREKLFQQTRGHALFTVELLRDMQARGALIKNQAGEWVEDPGLRWDVLPVRVEAAIAQRIERLPQSLRDLLQIACVEGESFTVEVAAELQGVGVPALLKQLSEELDRQHQLVRAESLVRIDGRRLSRYRFRHILFQRYLYTNLDPLLRTSLHEQVGEALERLYGEQAGEVAGQLARHFKEAGLHEKAIDYLVQAGERAVKLAANQEAVEYFSRALALAPERDLAVRFRLLLERVKVFHRTGQRQAEERDIQALETLAAGLGPAQQAQAALRRARWSTDTGRLDELNAAARAAIDLSQSGGQISLEAEGALFLAAYYFDINDPKSAVSMYEQALKLARQAGNRELEADILRELGIYYFYIYDFDAAISSAEEALQIYRSIGNRYGEGRAVNALAQAMYSCDDFYKAFIYHEQSWQICHEIGNRYDEIWALIMLGLWHEMLGSLPALSERLVEAREIAPTLNHAVLEAAPSFFIGEIYQLQGELSQALACVETGLEILQKTGLNLEVFEGWMAIGLVILGQIRADMGLSEQAAISFQQSAQMMRSRYELHAPLAGLARLALARGNAVQALSYTEKFLSHLEDIHPFTYSLSPLRSYLTGYQVFQANGDPRAGDILAKAYHLLQEQASTITNEAHRHSFLENVPWNREIRELWQAVQPGL